MSKRAVFSTFMTFALGLGGGVAATHLAPANSNLSLATKPADASPVQVSAPAQEDGIADLVDKVKVAVVNIDTEAHRRVQPQLDPFQFFNGQGGPQQMEPQERVQKGTGSGFLIREDGLIVTNNHVIQGADKLTVTLSNGEKRIGRVIGADPGTDLAVVKIDGHNLPTLKLADGNHLRVGQYVVAVGSPLGLQQTVTTGILSAINRDISLNARVGFLQTDAAINPGNSGGPLLNLKGEVIGVNTAIAARGQGIGFAIPVDTVNTIVPQLEAKGKVERAWIGVQVGNLPEDKSKMFYPADFGALVGHSEPNSPAAKAGLVAGDVITAIDGKKVENAIGLIREVNKLAAGKTVALQVSRQGQQKLIPVTLDAMPDKLAAGVPQRQQPQDDE
ncbi:MAG: protease HtrA [Cyanobacteria bacterium RYN_339]|nr:protease HtrA [Cyanobacteria bacterium RYN_339]